MRGAGSGFFAARATASEATGDRAPDAIRSLNDVVLNALGFEPQRETLDVVRNITDTLTLPVAATTETGAGLWLVALDTGLADSADDLFDVDATQATGEESEQASAGLLLEAGQRRGDKKQIATAAGAVGELFAVDEPPRFVLVLGGRIALLAEPAKWAEGRYLTVDLDAALERNDTKARASSRRLPPCSPPTRCSPAALTATAPRVRSTIWSRSHISTRWGSPRSFVPVSGRASKSQPTVTNERGAQQHRARSYPQLPNGSLTPRFELVNEGYHQQHAAQQVFLDDANVAGLSEELYLQFLGLGAQLFGTRSTKLLDGFTLRYEALQQVLRKLMLSTG